MTTAFADASALVKLYLDEPLSFPDGAGDGLAVSAMSRVEVISAVRRKQRSGELLDAAASVICATVDADFDDATGGVAGLTPVDVSQDVLQEAAVLLTRHSLSASDAVQLASAVAAREADPDVLAFACFDMRLRQAAATEGFRVLPSALSAE